MSSPREYDLGNVIRAAAVFRNIANVLIDPTEVRFQVKDPAGVVTEYVYGTNVQLVKDSVGNYHSDVTGNKTGRWSYRFYSTGSGEAAAESQFVIRSSNF